MSLDPCLKLFLDVPPGVKEDDDDCAKKQCPKDCLAGCCEKIPLIKLSCPEQDLTIKPQLFGVGRCTSDLITLCKDCKGNYFQPISDWVSCRLEAIALFFNMLDFEFYNDWMNGSLYFPLIKRKLKIKRAKILIMGLTFKENCPDLRNSGIYNVITELKKFECDLDLQDPWADKEDIKKIYNIYPNSKLIQNNYDAVLIAVAHNKFKKIGLGNIKKLCKETHVIFDLKNLFNSNQVDLRL